MTQSDCAASLSQEKPVAVGDTTQMPGPFSLFYLKRDSSCVVRARPTELFGGGPVGRYIKAVNPVAIGAIAVVALLVLLSLYVYRRRAMSHAGKSYNDWVDL